MRKAAVGMIAALAVGAQAASAEGFSYNLIEGSYSIADLDGADGNGFALKGSNALAPTVFLSSGIESLKFDDVAPDTDLDLDNLNLGVGFNWSLADNADLFGIATWERQAIDLDGVGSTSESGYGITGGVRGRLAESFEVSASVKYTDIGDFGDAFTYSAGGRWYFTESFAVGVDYNRLDLGEANVDGDAWVATLRYDFGDR
jgi:hypothetical protein